jgi:arylsulfatase A-like enzyme
MNGSYKKKINFRNFVLTTFIFCILYVIQYKVNLIAKEKESLIKERPNIIFILTDDHTKQAMSCYASQINQTPNIDRLAKEGILFNNSFVTNSICAPSRAVILTGKYSHINGLKDNKDQFNGNQMTFPKLLQQNGYQTALIGKWHLKTEPQGFDTWKILPDQGDYYNPKFIENGDTLKYEGYVTNLITDFTIETLEKFDDKKPFCLLYHHKAPHRNWIPDTKHLTMYEDIDIPLPPTFFDDYKSRIATAGSQDMKIVDLFNSWDMKLLIQNNEEEFSGGKISYKNQAPSWWRGVYDSWTEEQRLAWDAAYIQKNKAFLESKLSGKELAKWKYQRYIKDYLRCVASIDDNIGRLLDYLDQNGLTDNTMVIYTSDQGFYLGEHGWYDKRFMYEESFSMPLLIRYPEGISPALERDELVLNLDLCPTLLDYAGIEIPDDVQGVSLKPLLEDKVEEQWRQSIYYHYYEYPHGWHNVKKHYGIRTKQYKLIHFYDDISIKELYDLEKDPHELNNIYGDERFLKIQNELESKLVELRKYYKDFE